MKTLKIAVIAVALCASAFAGTLIDSANVFGPRGPEVAAALEGKPVTIETRETTPSYGMKEYADSKANETPRSFYIVITTKPRAWRISMNPVGLASSEGTRLAGDAMTAHFKRGQFAEGAIGLSEQLVSMMAVPVEATAIASLPAPSIPKEPEADHTLAWILAILAGAFSVIFVTVLLVKRSNAKAEAKAKAERDRRAAEDLKRRAKFGSKPASYMPTVSEAQRTYDSYTPKDRERIRIEYCNHPSYRSGVMDDPLLFWMFMNQVNQQSVYAPMGIPVYGNYYTPPTAPAPSYSPPSQPSSSYRSNDDDTPTRRSSSSSDSSGSSWSSDSGSSSSSSDSSSSSSDSSGSSSGGGDSW